MKHCTLTVAAIDRFKPPATGQVDHFDGSCPGLALRVSYGGRKCWTYHYRIDGRLRRMTLGLYPGSKVLTISPTIGLSLVQAREAWLRARQEVSAKRDPALAREREKPADDFATVAAEFLKRDQAKNKSRGEAERIINRELLPVWGRRPVNTLKRRDVLDMMDSIADRGALVMANRVQSLVHRFFKWCVGRGIVEINPAADLPRASAETSRDRVLTDDELVAVWNGAEQMGTPSGRAAQLLALTGARREEISALRWVEIEGNTITLSGTRTKNGEPHDIPLSAPALALIKGITPIVGSSYVFTVDGKLPISGWSRAKARLDELVQIEPWRLHDLRRTLATGCQKMGVNLQVTEAVLGHTSGSRGGIVGVYQRHDYADEKRTALEAWGAHVMALVEGRKAGVVLPIRGRRAAPSTP
jgi:integrase